MLRQALKRLHSLAEEEEEAPEPTLEEDSEPVLDTDAYEPEGRVDVVTKTYTRARLLVEMDKTCTYTEPTGKRVRVTDDTEEQRRMDRYWQQRYLYFSRMDEGCLIDTEGWYSVTPEVLADHIAQRVVEALGKLGGPIRVLDGFAGVGGNAIAFARAGCAVTAVDFNRERLDLAKHNANIYNVDVDFVHGDYVEHIRNVPADTYDVVFLSPPWGGPSYCERDVFRLRHISINDGSTKGREVLELALAHTPNVVYYAPRNSALRDLALPRTRKSLLPDEAFIQVQQLWLNDRFKALAVFYGPAFVSKRQAKLALYTPV